jgi:hypothetical protein
VGVGLGVLIAAVVGWMLRRTFTPTPVPPIDFSRLPVPGSDDIEITCLWCYKVAAVVARSLVFSDRWEPVRCRHCGMMLTSLPQESRGRWSVS